MKTRQEFTQKPCKKGFANYTRYDFFDNINIYRIHMLNNCKAQFCNVKFDRLE